MRDSLAEIARIPAVGAGDIAGDAYQLIAKLAMSTKEAKLTQIFAWGFKAWMTQQPAGYSLSGYIDGQEFDVVTDLPQEAERAFARAARSAWLQRKLRSLRGLPARESPPISTLDTYHGVSLRMIFVAVVTALWRILRTNGDGG